MCGGSDDALVGPLGAGRGTRGELGGIPEGPERGLFIGRGRKSGLEVCESPTQLGERGAHLEVVVVARERREETARFGFPTGRELCLERGDRLASLGGRRGEMAERCHAVECNKGSVACTAQRGDAAMLPPSTVIVQPVVLGARAKCKKAFATSSAMTSRPRRFERK